MHILHVSSECFPIIKTGGLADVLGALPQTQLRQGIQARLLLPGFPDVIAALHSLDSIQFIAERDSFAGLVQVYCATYQNLPIYFINAPHLYARAGNPYHDEHHVPYHDNYLRFGLFSWLASEFAHGLDPKWRPDLIHAHDWHAGLTPLYLKATHANIPSIMTIHNLAYQGLFPMHYSKMLHIPDEYLSINGIEFYGELSFLKAGIFFANHVTTVSPRYAQEITQAEFGCGLDGLLTYKKAQHQLTGILNGIDEEIWSPEHDPLITQTYTIEQLTNKRKNKKALQEKLGLTTKANTLLFGVVSRLSRQKGLDLLIDTIHTIMDHHAQLVILGTGDHDLSQQLIALTSHYPHQMVVIIEHNEIMAHQIISGSDVLIIPSRFEPCGLTQLYALKYGTLPLVRRTGGLADTVFDCSLENLAMNTANGFVFHDVSCDDLKAAILRAITLWQQPKKWKALQQQAMKQDMSWNRAAQQYSILYKQLLQN